LRVAIALSVQEQDTSKVKGQRLKVRIPATALGALRVSTNLTRDVHRPCLSYQAFTLWQAVVCAR